MMARRGGSSSSSSSVLTGLFAVAAAVGLGLSCQVAAAGVEEESRATWASIAAAWSQSSDIASAGLSGSGCGGGPSSPPAPPAAVLRPGASTAWLVDTTIRASNIPEAGRGRFIETFAPAGTVLFSFDLVRARELRARPTTPLAYRIDDEADLNALVALFPDDTLESLTDWIQAFLGGVTPDRDFDDASGLSLILTSGAFINHRSTGNTNLFVRDGKVVCLALADLCPGDELFIDYRTFYIAPGINDWYDRHGIVDVVSWGEKFEQQQVQQKAEPLLPDQADLASLPAEALVQPDLAAPGCHAQGVISL